ncbi:MAG: transposase [Rhodospirillales bacterium]|nr:transposase [Rhodospirillales bacterium]
MEPPYLEDPFDPGRRGTDWRRFVEAVLRIVRTGGPRCDRPPCFGTCKTVFRGYQDWVKADGFVRLFAACATVIDARSIPTGLRTPAPSWQSAARLPVRAAGRG